MDYLRRYGEFMQQIRVVVNIDDIGYIKGKTAYSFYKCPENVKAVAGDTFGRFEGLQEGMPWFQGDHMVFVQNGVPAIAMTTEYLSQLMGTITHSDKDIPEVVDCAKLVETAEALKQFIYTIN